MNEEKRIFHRDLMNSEAYILPVGKMIPINCLTCDISEGGIKIVTDKELDSGKYSIIMANQKFPVKVIYSENLGDGKFLYGMKFTKPISILLKKEIILNLNKNEILSKTDLSEKNASKDKK